MLNAAAWLASAALIKQRAAEFPPEVCATRRLLVWLSAVYVLGCAFRSFLPMIDVPRLCLLETPVSRIFVGRSAATIAELAFAAQWALLLREAGAVRASRAVLPLIGVAEVLSWLAVLTTNDLFHAAENATWSLTAVVVVAFFAVRWKYQGNPGRQVIAAAAGAAAGYLAFMAAYVVPMYLLRWQADTAAGREYLSLAQGLRETLGPCIVEREWALWWRDAAWLTPYFTLAVWLSIALPHLPPLASMTPRRK